MFVFTCIHMYTSNEALVNFNAWLTPDEANLTPGTGIP